MSSLPQNQKQSAYFVRKVNSQNVTANASINNQPKASSILNIPGTRTSLQNSQLLTPIGIPSIDNLIGGGLPVGSICLIGQDKNNYFTDIITRCFLAEGVLHKHALYVANLNETKENLFNRLPNVNKLESDLENKAKTSPSSNDQLRIAWRYGQQPQQQTNESNSSESSKLLQPNYFFMNKYMTYEEVTSSSDIKNFEINDKESDEPINCNLLYEMLYRDIESHIDSLNMNINKTKSFSNILRIVISSIGGLSWNDQCTINENDSQYLCRFLLNLRSVLRYSLGVCVITLPDEVVKNLDLIDRFSHLSDFVFIMDDSSTAVSGLTNTEYDGLFKLTKIPRLNSLMPCCTPESLDLAFYVKRKRLVVELLNLPPDIGEDDDKQKGRTSTAVSMSCSSTGSASSNKLDF